MNLIIDNQSLNDDLLRAIRKGKIDIVQDLLHKGADVECLDKRGRTALCIAAKSGNERVVIALLQKGANVNDKNAKISKALHIAAKDGHEKVVIALLSQETDTDNLRKKLSMALRVAGENGREKVITALIELGANVNSKSHSRRHSALHHAAHKGHEKAVIALLKAEVHIENVNKALYFAILKSYGRIVRALLNKGADANAIANKPWYVYYSWTALNIAADKDYKSIMKALYHLYIALYTATCIDIITFLLKKVTDFNSMKKWYFFIFLLLYYCFS